MKKELVCDKKDGFWFLSIFSYSGALLAKDAIIIDEKDTNKFVSYIKKKKIDKVIIDLWDTGIDSLDFLLEIPFIQFLSVWTGDIDYSPLYNLKHLKQLYVGGPHEINVDKIEGLESFFTAYPNSAKGIGEAKSLKSLKLYGHGPDLYNNYSNLNFLQNLSNLDTLILYNINVKSLEGIEYLKNLKVLILEDMKKLENIEHLRLLGSNLKHLRIENCNKIKDFNPIKDLRELVFLSVDRLKFVPNLDFISNSKNLKSFVSIDSNIIDGNLTYLLNLNHVCFYPMRKHYHIIKNNESKKAKESDFKHGKRDMGDEEVELWRRIAY